MYAYARKQLIDYKLGMALLIVTIPMALIGTWVAGYIPSEFLKVILGVGLLAIAVSFLKAPDHKEVEALNGAIQKEYGGEKTETCLITREGEEIRYTICNRTQGRIIAGLGGLFIGMISRAREN